MSKRHQHVAGGKKTRKGQARKGRHVEKNRLEKVAKEARQKGNKKVKQLGKTHAESLKYELREILQGR